MVKISLAKRKQKSKSQNKTKKNKLEYTSNYNKNGIWDNYGYVLNIKTNKYVRIGSNESMKAINQLEHNSEWKKRVEYIITNHNIFGKKLEQYLQKKGLLFNEFYDP